VLLEKELILQKRLNQQEFKEDFREKVQSLHQAQRAVLKENQNILTQMRH
jgi:hypothetical protein